MILGAMAILVLPLVTSAIEIGYGRRIGVIRVKVAHRIGTHPRCASVLGAIMASNAMSVWQKEAVVA